MQVRRLITYSTISWRGRTMETMWQRKWLVDNSSKKSLTVRVEMFKLSNLTGLSR